MSSIDDPGHDVPHLDPPLDPPRLDPMAHGLLPDRSHPRADPSKAPPRFASPRPNPIVRASYATYFDLPQLARDIAEAAVMRRPAGAAPFVLRSGHLSDYYIDKYAISTRPQLLDRVAFALGDLIVHRLPGDPFAHPARRPTRLAAIELGSVPIVIATSLEIGVPSVIIRRDAKTYGPKAMKDPTPETHPGMVHGSDEYEAYYDHAIAASMIEGRLDAIDIVVLVEDIVTTGFELVRGTHILRNFGIKPESIYAIAVVDREEGAARALADAGIAYTPLFTKTDLWID